MVVAFVEVSEILFVISFIAAAVCSKELAWFKVEVCRVFTYSKSSFDLESRSYDIKIGNK